MDEIPSKMPDNQIAVDVAHNYLKVLVKNAGLIFILVK